MRDGPCTAITHRSDVAAENLVQVEVDSLGAVVLAVPVVDDVKVVREGLVAGDQPLVEEVLQLPHSLRKWEII